MTYSKEQVKEKYQIFIDGLTETDLDALDFLSGGVLYGG